ncbi:MAG: hypothetical protein PHV28_17175, partial [Kiritimatiellae bacterium]|nr:hypothetical protein [Kiritimatiellia bacterium]
KVFDVKAEGNRLYTAEGHDGFGVYELDGAAPFKEVARLPKISSEKNLALYVQPAVPGWLFCSDRRGFELYDFRALPAFKHTLHSGACPGWDKYLANGSPDGRHFAFNNANTTLKWFDLAAVPVPRQTVETTVNRLSLSNGICTFRNGLSIASARGSYVLLRPGEGDPADGSPWKFLKLPAAFPGEGRGDAINGIPRSDGQRVVFTSRIERRAALYDFTDAERPTLLNAWTFSGNPDIADFHAGKVVIPCGYAGVLLQK